MPKRIAAALCAVFVTLTAVDTALAGDRCSKEDTHSKCGSTSNASECAYCIAPAVTHALVHNCKAWDYQSATRRDDTLRCAWDAVGTTRGDDWYALAYRMVKRDARYERQVLEALKADNDVRSWVGKNVDKYKAPEAPTSGCRAGDARHFGGVVADFMHHRCRDKSLWGQSDAQVECGWRGTVAKHREQFAKRGYATAAQREQCKAATLATAAVKNKIAELRSRDISPSTPAPAGSVSVWPTSVRVSVENGGNAVVTLTNKSGKRLRVTRFDAPPEVVADLSVLEDNKIPRFVPVGRGFDMDKYGRVRVRIRAAARTAAGSSKTLKIEYQLAGEPVAVREVQVELFNDPVQCKTADDVCFIAFGDQGTGDAAQIDVGNAMANWIGSEKAPRNRTDFLIGLGDNFYNDFVDDGVHGCNSDQFTSKFEGPYKGIRRDFYMTMGNHDVIVGAKSKAQICYGKQDTTRGDDDKSPRFNMPDRYYTFQKGPVQFFALFTPGIVREEYTVALSKAKLQEQVRWLERELAKSTARWKIVYGHHPAFTYAWRQGPEIYQHLLPLFVKYKVDVYVTGHDHSQHHYRHPAYRDIDFIVTGNAGGKGGTEQPATGDYARFETHERGFVYFKISGDKLTFQVVNDNGSVVYAYTRKQPATRQSEVPQMPRCAPGREKSMGQCFPECRPGFEGTGPTCYAVCPPGYKTDLATCRRNLQVINANVETCPKLDKCGVFKKGGCSVCPDGWRNDGCTCRIDAHIFGRESYNRSDWSAGFVFGKQW